MNTIFLLLGIASLSTAVVDPDPPAPWLPEYGGEYPPYLYGRDSITPKSKTCEVKSGDPNGDDTSAILKAFNECKEDGHILFSNTTYYVGQAMTTTGLKNVDIELQGTMEWSKDIDYWLNNSLPIGFQNQSTAWLLGGDNIHFYGHGYGTLFGNGDVWYVFNNGTSNLQGRPHAISIHNTTNSLIEGLRFIQSQISNIYMANNTFHKGLAYAMGSIGQYENQVNFIENITAIDTICLDTAYAGRIKSWTGRNTGVPPNGGGGGLGWARNISFTNFTLQNVDTPWYITQCTSYNGVEGGCDTSLFHIENMHWGNTTGTTKNNLVLSLQCSGAAPCTNIDIFDNDLKVQSNGTKPEEFLCSNVEDPKGFNCTGKAPNTSG
ncbi:uncharacterized protein N0V89_003013 [Didymosphaeria variabile]|uniref:Glycoside hydrolase family 28 protein n=1 Tax=Didymosphaeria variabile TaxID=1932322 RepID=A0A9W9CEZ0_9PLEO|nr:uncharacterized protein N0V89_003013 [Didymosphaeria variabile]KAJ4358430.1 hypothetical protein N0V89_003013 [Didymosphaeria variabile]